MSVRTPKTRTRQPEKPKRDGAGNCLEVDSTITNFKFDPGYNVDLILFREVIGTVTDALYIKPHITYRVTEDLGIRGDFMWANALVQASTPGLQFPLGIELDGTAWYRSDDGFFLMFQGGVLIPLGPARQTAGMFHPLHVPDDTFHPATKGIRGLQARLRGKNNVGL